MTQEKNKRSLFFRARLHALLTERGISQRELATATGLTPQSVSNYIRGTRSLPGAEELYVLAKYFNVTMESFLDDGDPPATKEQKKPVPSAVKLREMAKRMEQVSAELKTQAGELKKLAD